MIHKKCLECAKFSSDFNWCGIAKSCTYILEGGRVCQQYRKREPRRTRAERRALEKARIRQRRYRARDKAPVFEQLTFGGV